MGNFKFTLKTFFITVAAVICIFLTFGKQVQDEKSTELKNHPVDSAAYSSLQVKNVPLTLGQEPLMPRGFNPNATWRDPFAAPLKLTGDAVQKTMPLALAKNSGDIIQPKQTDPPLALPENKEHPAELPQLVGIVSSASRQMAIIHYKGLSRSYSLGESIGVYQLKQITENAAVLEGFKGLVTIRLSRH